MRLSKSVHADKFIFKGGYLLAYLMNIGRETTDLDFLLTRMKAEEPLIRENCRGFEASSRDGRSYCYNQSFPMIDCILKTC